MVLLGFGCWLFCSLFFWTSLSFAPALLQRFGRSVDRSTIDHGRMAATSHRRYAAGRSNLPVLTTINYMQPWPTHLPPASSAPRRRRPRPASLPARRRQAGLPLLAQQPPLRRHLPVRAAAGEDGADRAARRGEEGGAEVGAAAAVAGGVGGL